MPKEFDVFDTAFKVIVTEISPLTYRWSKQSGFGRECYAWLKSILKGRRDKDQIFVHFNNDDIPVAVSWTYDDEKTFFPETPQRPQGGAHDKRNNRPGKRAR